jgi:hypothetical protein
MSNPSGDNGRMKRLVSIWRGLAAWAAMLEVAFLAGRVIVCVPFADMAKLGAREVERLIGDAAEVRSFRTPRSALRTYTVKVVPLLMQGGSRDVDFIYSIERQRFSELAMRPRFMESEIRLSLTSNRAPHFHRN